MHESYITKTKFRGFTNLFKGIIFFIFTIINLFIFIYDIKNDYDQNTYIWLFNTIIGLLSSIIYLYLHKKENHV